VRDGVVDEETVLLVLAGVREVQAERLELGAGGGEPGRRRDPHQVAAEGDDDMLEARVAPQPRGVRRHVHGVVRPVMDAHHGELRCVLEVDLDVGTERPAAPVVEHDHALRTGCGPQQQAAVGVPLAVSRTVAGLLGHRDFSRDDRAWPAKVQACARPVLGGAGEGRAAGRPRHGLGREAGRDVRPRPRGRARSPGAPACSSRGGRAA
jgi:hypothetical protein